MTDKKIKNRRIIRDVLITVGIIVLSVATAQFGIFFTLCMATMFFPEIKDAASIAIIGAADGPASIVVANALGSNYVGAITVATMQSASLRLISTYTKISRSRERSIAGGFLYGKRKGEKLRILLLLVELVHRIYDIVITLEEFENFNKSVNRHLDSRLTDSFCASEGREACVHVFVIGEVGLVSTDSELFRNLKAMHVTAAFGIKFIRPYEMRVSSVNQCGLSEIGVSAAGACFGKAFKSFYILICEH